jgi:7-carboxy-7-deazaguanine synthase
MTVYPLNDIYVCVQGEGCMTGQAMALVRLQGCPVGCPFCDTKETWRLDEAHKVGSIAEALGTNPRWCEATPYAIAFHLFMNFPRMPWVLVTGGEPADQDLAPLVRELHDAGFKAAVETSGTAEGHTAANFDWVCVSPKFGMPGGRPVLTRVLETADELKFVVGTAADLARVDETLAGLLPPRDRPRHVCLQPMSANPKATRLCTETVKEMGWRLSVQLHKLLEER